MPRITFVDAAGTSSAVDTQAGISLMEVARNHGVAGILADCGGTCACGTCRIHLDEAWWSKLEGPNEIEAATLDGHDDPEERKRLSCQITVTEDMDGMTVRLPASQF